MKIAFQLDPPASLNLRWDTSLMLIEEAQRRGMECYYYDVASLAWHAGELTAQLHSIRVDPTKTPAIITGEAQRQSLHEMRMVWMRQDPPFDMRYITATYLLERLLPDTRVWNHPAGVRNAPEKLSALAFSDMLPPTLISSDPEQVLEFAHQHGTIVAKPLYGYGGRGVYKFDAEDGNIVTLIEQTQLLEALPLMWQAFLPQVANQDMRVILVNGEVVTQFLRIPAAGSIRANMRVGGTPQAASLTPEQHTFCERLKPWLRQEGLLLAGLDFIGNSLTEINVTSPTGLRAAQALYGIDLSTQVWDAALA